MKYLLTFVLAANPLTAFAHAGHFGEFAGHDHWVAGLALGAAVGVAVWGWLKDKDNPGAAESEETSDGDEAEA